MCMFHSSSLKTRNAAPRSSVITSATVAARRRPWRVIRIDHAIEKLEVSRRAVLSAADPVDVVVDAGGELHRIFGAIAQ